MQKIYSKTQHIMKGSFLTRLRVTLFYEHSEMYTFILTNSTLSRIAHTFLYEYLTEILNKTQTSY